MSVVATLLVKIDAFVLAGAFGTMVGLAVFRVSANSLVVLVGLFDFCGIVKNRETSVSFSIVFDVVVASLDFKPDETVGCDS